MTCICADALAQLLLSLLPMIRLGPIALRIPPLLEELSNGLPALVSSRLMAGAQLAAMARLKLAAFPLSPLALANIQGLAGAYLQLQALGINPESRGASAQLSALIGSMNINLGGLRLPLTPVSLASLLGISRACSIILAVRSTLGVDLLAANASMQLRAALTLALDAPKPPFSPTKLANMSAYAALAASAAPFGGIEGLLPALRIMLSLRIPSLNINLPSLGNLLALLTALSNIRAALSIDPFAVNAMALIRARLALLIPLNSLSLNLGLGGARSVHLDLILPNLPALPSLRVALAAHLNLLLRLPILNLAPINMAAALVAEGSLASKSQCSSSCPISRYL